jgi:hypothetical protein
METAIARAVTCLILMLILNQEGRRKKEKILILMEDSKNFRIRISIRIIWSFQSSIFLLKLFTFRF